MSLRLYLAALLAIVSITACASENTESDELGSWALEEDLRIGSAASAEADEFSRIADVWVDDLDRMWVIDAMTVEIRVFDPDGRHVRTFGTRGAGPGELALPLTLEAGPDEHVWVADSGNRRWAVFDTAGAFTAHHPYAPGMYRFGDRWGSDGLLYTHLAPATLADTDVLIVRRALRDTGLEPVDTIETPPLPFGERVPISFVRDGRQMTMMVPMPFQATGVRLLDAGSGWWVGAPGPEYAVTLQSFAGDTLIRIHRDAPRVPVTAVQIDAALERMGVEGMDRSLVPEYHPPYRELWRLPDGHLLVRRTAEAGDAVDVFDDGGSFQSTLSLPLGDRFELFHATDRALYGAYEDDFGVPHVVRVAIRR